MRRSRAKTNVIGRVAALLPQVALLFLLSTHEVTAADVPDAIADTPSYFVVNQKIGDFLTAYAADASIRIDLTPAITGRIRDTQIGGSPEEVFADLANTHELEWFQFNDIFYLSTRSEAATRIIRLGDLDSKLALAALSEAGLTDVSFSVRVLPESGSIALAGPPKYLGLSEAVIEAIPIASAAPDVKPAAAKTIIVRRGNVAEEVEVRFNK